LLLDLARAGLPAFLLSASSAKQDPSIAGLQIYRSGQLFFFELMGYTEQRGQNMLGMEVTRALNGRGNSFMSVANIFFQASAWYGVKVTICKCLDACSD